MVSIHGTSESSSGLAAQLVGHGVDRGGEPLAHASTEVTGVADDDQVARRPHLVQLPRSVERAGDVVEAVNQRGGDVRDPRRASQDDPPPSPRPVTGPRRCS